jgi:SpoIID/LytB domain protein
MARVLKRILYLLLFSLLLSCAGLRKPAVRLGPVIRVGLLTGRSEMRFEPHGPFLVISKTPGQRFRSHDRGSWLARVSRGRDNPADASDSSGPLKVNLISPSGDTTAISAPLRISAAFTTIKEIEVGRGFHWHRKEDRTYRGEIEIRLDPGGKMTVINVIPAEVYLEGVLPAEMTDSFPQEALKAQAIAARTFTFNQLERAHRDEPYDLCDEPHCQSYLGVGKESARIKKAVRETAGLVLTCKDELCTTPYSALCGGHTENAENVWDGDSLSYLQGDFDIPSPGRIRQAFDLSKEENLARWITSSPLVNCNIQRGGRPDFAHYAEKYFRWQKRIGREDLERTIETESGREIGTLLDLRPLRRGLSGRLMEILVIGTKDTLTLRKELNIRRALSETTLFSACFIVEKESDVFIFKGAGWGHGVGMCQIGAGMMALKDKSHPEILQHYYRGTRIKAFY